MPKIRIQRLEKELLKLINNVLAFKMRNKNLSWVTITNIRFSNDMSYAKIYFSFLGDNSKEKVLNSLQKSAGFIKNEIAKAKMMRVIPELIFYYDELEENARKLDKIFEKINSEKDGNNES